MQSRALQALRLYRSPHKRRDEPARILHPIHHPSLSLSLQCGGFGGKSNSHREDGEGAMVASRSSLANCCLLVLISFCVLRLGDRIDYGTLTLILPRANTTAVGDAKDAVDRGAARRNYIVRFVEYRDAADHRAYLQGEIKLDGWEWIERRNPAAKFPTDFGLVAIDDSVRTAVIEALERLELVKDVSADLSYSRSALSEGAGRVGAFVDGKKRPGKIFSSMSYSEGDYYATAISNSTISWNRHLMMQARKFEERRLRPQILIFYFISFLLKIVTIRSSKPITNNLSRRVFVFTRSK